MQTTQPMSSEDRNFFSLVADAIYLNPFEEKRSQTLKKVEPEIQLDPTLNIFRIRDIANRLNKRIESLEAKGLKTSGFSRDGPHHDAFRFSAPDLSTF